MSNLNKVMLIGRIGKDPEVRHMPNGNAVATASLATSEKWTDKASGEKKEATEWHRLTFFERLAEIVSEYVHKGDLIYVEGKLTTRKWQDKDGNDRYTTEVRVNQMQMLGSKREGSEQPQRAPAQPAARAPVKPSPSFDDMDDDIPF